MLAIFWRIKSWGLSTMTRARLLLCFSFLSAVSSAYATDIYTCPELKLANGHSQTAISVELFSGHPSEMALLKPDNADTDDTNPAYWSLGPSPYATWYVCHYQHHEKKNEFMLPKTYDTCTNIGKAQAKDKLECK
jgi:hypothetical protein